jgi:hypothetical protein
MNFGVNGHPSPLLGKRLIPQARRNAGQHYCYHYNGNDRAWTCNCSCNVERDYRFWNLPIPAGRPFRWIRLEIFLV